MEEPAHIRAITSRLQTKLRQIQRGSATEYDELPGMAVVVGLGSLAILIGRNGEVEVDGHD